MRLLSAELLKLRRRLMVRILLVILLAIIGLVCWGIGTTGSQRDNLFFPNGWLVAVFLVASLGPFIFPILAGSWAGNEYSWGTVRMVLSRRPDRSQFVLAGVVTLLAAVGVALVLAIIVESVVGGIVAAATGNTFIVSGGFNGTFLGLFIKSFFAAWLVLSFYVVLAYAAGTLFRSGAVGIGLGIGITLAEFVLRGILFVLGGVWKGVSEHFPSVYTGALESRLASEGLTHNFASVSSSAPSIPAALVALAVYIAVPLALALFLVRTRDVTA